MPTHLQVSLSLACYNVDRFVASSLFCVRLYLKSYIAVFGSTYTISTEDMAIV